MSISDTPDETLIMASQAPQHGLGAAAGPEMSRRLRMSIEKLEKELISFKQSVEVQSAATNKLNKLITTLTIIGTVLAITQTILAFRH